MTDLGARTMDRPDQPVRNPPRATAVTRTPNGTTSGARADRCLPAMRGRAPSLLSPGHAAQAPGHGHLRAESWSKAAGPSLIDRLPAEGSVTSHEVGLVAACHRQITEAFRVLTSSLEDLMLLHHRSYRKISYDEG